MILRSLTAVYHTVYVSYSRTLSSWVLFHLLGGVSHRYVPFVMQVLQEECDFDEGELVHTCPLHSYRRRMRFSEISNGLKFTMRHRLCLSRPECCNAATFRSCDGACRYASSSTRSPLSAIFLNHNNTTNTTTTRERAKVATEIQVQYMYLKLEQGSG